MLSVASLAILCSVITKADCFCFSVFCQAYTSQFVALIMFALLMSEDKISMQPRRRELIQGLKVLPGKPDHHYLLLTVKSVSY